MHWLETGILLMHSEAEDKLGCMFLLLFFLFVYNHYFSLPRNRLFTFYFSLFLSSGCFYEWETLNCVTWALHFIFHIFQVLETAKTARTLFPYVSLIDPRTTHISAILCGQMVTEGFDTCIAFHQNAYIGAVFELMTGRNLWFGSMFVSDLSFKYATICCFYE